MQDVPIKILSTKAIPDDLIQQAKATNIEMDTVSFIETKPTHNISVIEKIKQFSVQKITAIFTSTSSIDSVFSIANTKPDWKIFCTSGATKDRLLNYVNEDAIVATAYNASALSAKVLENKDIKSCIFFCGNQRLNTLPVKLLEGAINIEEVVVYETIASPKKIDEVYNGILFFSPSAVESFFSMNTIDSKVILFSVGATTAKAIRKFANNTTVTAVLPSVESVVKEVNDYFMSDTGFIDS